MTKRRPKLQLSQDLELPEEAVTETFAILGKRGVGKTTTARVLTEELLEVGLPVLILDPTGVWWGLRTSADGKTAGYPVVIFGGDHADVPLEETAGTLIADVIVSQRISAVLDLSSLSKGGTRRFSTDLLERLYHRNREPLHVVIDEADLLAPQRVAHGGERLLGAMSDLVRRGRVRGLGVSMITQSPVDCTLGLSE
jgi:DNA helicase HerA-like ATPase